MNTFQQEYNFFYLQISNRKCLPAYFIYVEMGRFTTIVFDIFTTYGSNIFSRSII